MLSLLPACLPLHSDVPPGVVFALSTDGRAAFWRRTSLAGHAVAQPIGLLNFPGTHSSFTLFRLCLLCLRRVHATLFRACLGCTLVRILILPLLCILRTCLQAASLPAGAQKAVDVDVGGNSVGAGGVRSNYL